MISCNMANADSPKVVVIPLLEGTSPAITFLGTTSTCKITGIKSTIVYCLSKHISHKIILLSNLNHDLHLCTLRYQNTNKILQLTETEYEQRVMGGVTGLAFN